MANSGPNSYRQFIKELAVLRLEKQKVSTDPITGKKKKVKVLGTRRDIQDKRDILFSFDRYFIADTVNKQFSKIQAKFPDIKKSELIESSFRVLKANISRYVDGKKFIWFDKAKTEIFARNFRQLQEDLISNVKKDIRQQTLNKINIERTKLAKGASDSSSKLISRNAAVSIVLSGTDPRPQSYGGDLIPTDLDNGVIVSRATRRLTDLAKSEGTGFQIGHTFGPGVGNVTAFSGVEEDSEIMSLFSDDIKLQLRGLRDRAIEADARLDIDMALFELSGKDQGKLTITVVEPSLGNAETGGSLSDIAKELSDIIEAEAVRLATIYSSSPTILDRYKAGIEELFLTGQVKNKGRVKKTYRHRESEVTKIPVVAPIFTSAKANPKRRRKKSQELSNTDLIVDLLNIKLHDKIRENMGKGGSKQTLNYRTGRFAKSAKVRSLSPSSEKNAINAQVKYMRYPYGTFEPGGRLYKPGRDPHGIFGRSIRQILQEEKIANLRKVKVNLNG